MGGVSDRNGTMAYQMHDSASVHFEVNYENTKLFNSTHLLYVIAYLKKLHLEAL